MNINFNKFESISTVDFPGRSCSVVFLNGCNYQCKDCHNKTTWTEKNFIDIEIIKEKIINVKPFISSVVFSGGEPTKQILPLLELCKFCKDSGLMVGIETNGSYPSGLRLLKPFVDLFLIDIKAPINNPHAYYEATKDINGAYFVNLSLSLDIPIEIRIVDFNKKITKEIINSLPGNIKVSIMSVNKNNHE